MELNHCNRSACAQIIDSLRAENERLKAELEVEEKRFNDLIDDYAKAVKELAQWKNNHKNVVDRLRLATQRNDLPVDRIPAIKRMEELQEELAAIRQSQQAVEPKYSPTLTECPRCKNNVEKCDGVFAPQPSQQVGEVVPYEVWQERVACARVADKFAHEEGPGERRYSGNVISANILARTKGPIGQPSDDARDAALKLARSALVQWHVPENRYAAIEAIDAAMQKGGV